MDTALGQSPIPTRHAVRTLIESLVGRDLAIADAPPLPVDPTNLIAAYVTDALQVSALVVVDFALAARLGGALGMLPKGGVDDAVKERELFGMMRDNCYEVLNVLASVFNVPDAPHVRLYELYGPVTAVPSDVMGLCSMIGTRMDLAVTVAGYGDGRLSVVIR